MPDSTIIEEITKAIYAHGTWKQQLRNVVTSGDTGLIAEMARGHNSCELGRLLDSPAIPEQMRASMSYQIVFRLHSEFHACADNVLVQAQINPGKAADILLGGECSDRSQVLIAALTRWKTELLQGTIAQAS